MEFNLEKIKNRYAKEFQNSSNNKILKMISKQSFGKDKTTYLITGGCGFIGSNLANELAKDPKNLVVVVDIVKKNLDDSVLFLNLDLSTIFESHQIDYEKFDYIFHFSADVGVKNFSVCPSISFINNYLIDKNMIEILTSRRFKKIPRIIYASTSEVFGDCENASETSDFKILNSPRGSYACEKLSMETLLKNFQIPHTIVRFFNIAGIGQSSKDGHVIPTFIEHALKNEPLTLFNNGDEIRCFCDIRDCIEMLKIVKDLDGDFNIGSENEIKIKDLAQLIIQMTNSKSELKFEENSQKISFRKPNVQKINKLYKAKYNINDIIENVLSNL